MDQLRPCQQRLLTFDNLRQCRLLCLLLTHRRHRRHRHLRLQQHLSAHALLMALDVTTRAAIAALENATTYLFGIAPLRGTMLRLLRYFVRN